MKAGDEGGNADTCLDLKPNGTEIFSFFSFFSLFLWQTNSLLACNKQGCSRLPLPKWHSFCTSTILGVQGYLLHWITNPCSPCAFFWKGKNGVRKGLDPWSWVSLHKPAELFLFPSTFSILGPLCVFPKWKAPCSTMLTPRLKSCDSTEEVNREFLLLWPHPSREGGYSTCGSLSNHSLPDSSPAHQYPSLVWSGLLDSGWLQTASAGPWLFLPSSGLVWPPWAHRRWPVVALGARLLCPLGTSVVWSCKKALAASKTCLDGELWLRELQLKVQYIEDKGLAPTINL